MNKIERTGNIPKAIFPDETDAGTIWIEGNSIFYKVKGRSSVRKVNLDLLQHVYIVVNKNGKSSLFLFDHHQTYLPVYFKGFKQAYLMLSQKFGFDDALFFKHVHRTEIAKKEIWRRKEGPTYLVLKDGGYKDYGIGFEIQSPKKQFISWDTTYSALAENDSIYFDVSPYDQKILRFRYPVRIGNIIFRELTAYFENRRLDVAVMDFYAHCYDRSNSEISYHELKERLKNDIDPKGHKLVSERADQYNYTFDVSGIVLSLVYTFDSDWSFERGYTAFTIKNNRAYPHLLIDDDYEKELEISDSIKLHEQANIVGDYRVNSGVKRRPPQLRLTSGDKPLIWVDKKNNKVGFADKEYSFVLDAAVIDSFAIENILPAKGPGIAYLLINFNNGENTFAVMSGKCHIFDRVEKDIAELTQKVVLMEPEQYDC